jgi:hypothetical protein
MPRQIWILTYNLPVSSVAPSMTLRENIAAILATGRRHRNLGG